MSVQEAPETGHKRSEVQVGQYLALGAGLGAAIGALLGVVAGDLGFWMAMGVPLGVGSGLAFGVAATSGLRRPSWSPPSKAPGWVMLQVVMGLMAGHGIYWFVSGAAQTAAPGRIQAVVGQILIGVGLFVYAEIMRRRRTKNGPE